MLGEFCVFRWGRGEGTDGGAMQVWTGERLHADGQVSIGRVPLSQGGRDQPHERDARLLHRIGAFLSPRRCHFDGLIPSSQVLEKLGRRREALELYEKACLLAPESPAVRFKRVRILISLKQYQVRPLSTSSLYSR